MSATFWNRRKRKAAETNKATKVEKVEAEKKPAKKGGAKKNDKRAD